MKLRMQLLLGFLLVLVLMIFMAVVSYLGSEMLLAARQWAKRSQEVVSVGLGIQSNVVGMQSSKRGYLLTGNQELLQRYVKRRQNYETGLARLKVLVGDDPDQAGRVAEIETLVERWLRAATGEIDARRRVAEGKAGVEDVLARFAEDPINLGLFNTIDDRMEALVAAERSALDARGHEAEMAARQGNAAMLGGTGLAIVLGIGVMLLITRRVLRQVGGEPAEIAAATEQIAQGNLEVNPGGETGIAASIAQMSATMKAVARQANVIASGDYSAEIVPRSNKDELGIALRAMNTALRTAHEEGTTRDWLRTGLARLNEAMRGDPEILSLASKVISEIAGYLDAQLGALYVARDGASPKLALMGSYAYTRRKNLSHEFGLGEGLVGQAALEKKQILVGNVPDDYVRVTSGLGERIPRFICVTPFIHEGRLQGVVELGKLKEMSELEMEYLVQAMPALAVAVDSAHRRMQLATSLEESQRLAEELQTQQEELRVANEELEEQTQRLRDSEERLRVQQEELQVTNEELEEKNDLLERQKRDVEQARRDITAKADELALASRYKSEFLANMSHELRTPLNSLLLLAQSLARNQDGNLSEDQVESARVIHGSGSDLLHLINEILDLSKIEAGRMELQLAPVRVEDLAEGVRASFGHMIEDKGLSLEILVSPGAPAEVVSDRKRIDQVIRNLMSNAIKFTESGGITVTFDRPAPGNGLPRGPLAEGAGLAVAVKDTGIGIAPDRRKMIFEAFMQEDGGTARRYGGTGLGLTISRQLATLLGGEIQLESEPGVGSIFTLQLPVAPKARQVESVAEPYAPRSIARGKATATSDGAANEARYIPDDRDTIAGSDPVILIIEDDPRFARILLDKCREKGFKGIAASTGEAGLALATRYLPRAVILDIRLPCMDGLAVLSALKEDTRTRHIPVHVVSVEEHGSESLRKGAVGHAVKPLDQERLEEVFQRLQQVSAARQKRVLVVEDDPQVRSETARLIEGGDVRVDEAETGEQALQALRCSHYDCMVLDLKLPDMDGREMLDRIGREDMKPPPVIVHTARDLTSEQEMALREHADSIVIKDVRSPERLLDEVSLFLHRVVSEMPEKKRKIILDLHDSDASLRDRKVLIVDDDMRTMFALSRLLSERGMKPMKAENGDRALRLLDENTDVDLVLMDIMMPVMDGYEAMKRIRVQERFRKLPVIALTAKAMPEDREKCLAAGASDYLPKPIDAGRLFSMMRVWLHG